VLKGLCIQSNQKASKTGILTSPSSEENQRELIEIVAMAEVIELNVEIFRLSILTSLKTVCVQILD
jgi:hypothetical protein